jgi:Putative amidoligase enzyme
MSNRSMLMSISAGAIPLAQNKFELPPALCNGAGETRTVGIEIEFTGLNARDAAYLVAAAFGGNVVEDDRHGCRVKDSAFGDFSIKLDSRYGHYEGKPRNLIEEAGAILASLVGDAASLVVPYEIAVPPVPIDRLDEIEDLISRLREHGAMGTKESVLYAFALHFNPEAPRLEAQAIVAVLKAYALLSPWLWRTINPDPTRRVLGFAEPFPQHYVQRLAGEDYWPGVPELIDHYIEANPTRNRDLDLLPLLAFLDEDRVRAALPNEKINPRPTFHYRLPDSRLGDPRWNLATEWNRWVAVERLAGDRKRLADVGRAYLGQLDAVQEWADRVPELAFA